MVACPALFISAPASGQGKTTITAGLARYHRRLGRRVRVFKTGPDFLDPMVLARASGADVFSLDLWMVGEAACRALLVQAAGEADLILVEGVMGLFDGTPSSADLATAFGIPVVAVISAKSMAQTFAAVAFGLSHFRPQVPFHGVFANRVGSARHASMLKEALPADLRWLGHIASSDGIELPDRHLGLHQADEIRDFDTRIDRVADVLAETALVALPPAVEFGSALFGSTFDAGADEPPAPLLDKVHVAVARDAAFSFIYPANLACLKALGRPGKPVFSAARRGRAGIRRRGVSARRVSGITCVSTDVERGDREIDPCACRRRQTDLCRMRGDAVSARFAGGYRGCVHADAGADSRPGGHAEAVCGPRHAAACYRSRNDDGPRLSLFRHSDAA